MAVETSIIIRTLNEAKHLEKLLKGIHGQNYHDWEIILVDSGSTDDTIGIASRYGARIFHIPQAEFTFGRSLNLGCQQARGRYLLFASGHVWPVTNNWLRNMVKPFEEPAVAMVYGRQRGTDTSRLSELKDLEDQFGPTSHIFVDEPKGNNGNAATRHDLWLDQPFDESLPGLEDVDWARKAEKKGYRVYYAANAVVYHSHEETLRQVYRRYFREAVATKRMFPHNQFTWPDLAKGVPYFTVRDILYALRKDKRGKIFQVPGSRLAQLLGIYRGFRYQKQLSRSLLQSLEIPESYLTVTIDGPGNHGVRQAKIPELQAREVLIQVAYASVNSTDFEMANGQAGGTSGNLANHPVAPGQIYSGIVVRSGDDVRQFKTGQKVVGDRAVGPYEVSLSTDEECTASARDQGADAAPKNVAYAQYIVARESGLRKLPMDISLQQATLIKLVGDCVLHVRHLRADPGRSACVLGAGSIGNLCAQVLAAWGLRVTVVDPDPRRLSLLHKYDVDTLNEAGDLERYDYVVDAAGDSNLATQLKEGSQVPEILSLSASVSRDNSRLNAGTIPGAGDPASDSNSHQRDSWQEAISLVRKGAVRLDDHTDAVEPFEAYGKAWERARAREHINVLLQVSKELEPL